MGQVLDDDLLRRFQSGDHAAVTAVYRTYSSRVMAVAYRTLGDRGLAEEACQQSFLKAWQAADRLDPSRDPGPWLCTIAHRCALDIARRERRRPAVATETSRLAHLAGATDNPDEAAAALEAWDLRSSLAQLDPEEREVLKLRYLDDLGVQDIADRLGIPAGTVKSRASRARHHLLALVGNEPT